MVSAVIGMKQESQRVKNKNFKLLGHKPLFSWIIDSLLEVDEIGEVLLNIQGKKLIDLISAKYSSQSRLKVFEREELLEGHEVPMTKIISNTILNAKYETIINTHSTNPFLSPTSISNALEIFKKNKIPIFSVNVFQSRFYDKNIKPINHNPKELLQTQDLDKIYEENSCLYIFNKDEFLSKKTRIFENSKVFPLNKIESIDIDTNEDWQLAEMIAKSFK